MTDNQLLLSVQFIQSKIAEKLLTEKHVRFIEQLDGKEWHDDSSQEESTTKFDNRKHREMILERGLKFVQSILWKEEHSLMVSQFIMENNALVLFTSIEILGPIQQHQHQQLYTTSSSEFYLVSNVHHSNNTINKTNNENNIQLTMFVKPFMVNYCTSRRVLYFVRQQDSDRQSNGVGLSPNGNRSFRFLMSGVIVDTALDTLLRVIRGTFSPLLLSREKNLWPESLQKDFVSQLHKFLASLTETAHKIKGSTVLYVPFENIDSIESAQKQKELVQRLEAVLMQWTSQIKEVVQADKDTAENIENARPLAEIEYWKSRAKDLMNIKSQIQREDVQTIVKVLSGSSYLKTFKDLSEDIQNGSDEALDNHKFLLTLKEPCEKLAAASPTQIPMIIPEILHLIHKIHDVFLKDTHKTQERLTGLLREVSNEIIYRCCQHILIDQIWNGNVQTCIQSLNESIHAGEAWKRMCNKQEDYFKFDKSSVFGEINAFVQRCNELLELCEAQIQFGSNFNNFESTMDLPVFAGTTGPEVTKNLQDIQSSFSRYIHEVRQLQYPILDVKSTAWHDDFKKFKNGIRDLELIMQNVISSAFETITDTENAIQLLEAFHSLAKRENIKTIVEVRAGEVCSNFQKQLETVQSQFEMNRKAPMIPPHHPRYSGGALWAHSISSKIQHEMNMIQNASFISETREHRDLKLKYDSIVQLLEKHINKMYSEWLLTIDVSMIQKVLDQPLMIRCQDSPHLIRMNFDSKLIVLYEEVRFWRQLPHLEMPVGVLELIGDRDKMRIYRENVATVVRSFNQIILSLSLEEHKLFRQRIQMLENEIKKGLIKQAGVKCYSWSSRAEIEVFVKGCKKMCEEFRGVLNDFKQGVTNIYLSCNKMADTLFINIESKKVYNEIEMEFEKEQNSHREKAKDQLLKANQDIVSILQQLYQYFEDHDEFVHEQWWSFIHTIEQRIDWSLRNAVKKSLRALSIAIRPEKSNEVGRLINTSPLFMVNVVLEKDDNDMTPALQPSIPRLIDMVDEVIRHLIRVSSVVPKLEQSMKKHIEFQRAKKLAEMQIADLADSPEDDESDLGSGDENDEDVGEQKKEILNYFDHNISEDKEIRQLIKVIIEGMDTVSTDVEEYLSRWSKDFREIWFTNKEKFLARFGSQGRTAEGFETEIDKYKDHQFKIQNMEPTRIVSYLQLESAPLKHTLVMECSMWQTRLLDLLHSIAQKEMNKFYEMFEKNSELLRQQPTNLEALEEKIKLVTKLTQDYPKNEQQFHPICERYDLLKKFDVTVEDVEEERKVNLKEAGHQFKKRIEESLSSLEVDKDKFRVKLKSAVDVFTQNILTLKSDFTSKGPYSAQISINQANTILREFKNKILLQRKEEAKLRSGMKLFNLEMPQYKELKDVSKDIDSLERVWSIQADWSECLKRWRQTPFIDLIVEKFQSELNQLNERVNSFGKDVREWGVWMNVKEGVDKFKKMLPLLIDLKSPAIRGRHWDELGDIMGVSIDINSSSFNLKSMMDLGFENYLEDINNMSNSATQELNIESDLEKIRDVWQTTIFDMVEYKSIYFKLNSTEEIFLNLDDNMATLSSMKISPYVGSFQTEVNELERNLSRISETIDMLLQVQKQWIYLFNIFDVDDIQKQLPTETGVFKIVNSRWKGVMSNLWDTRNVYRACQRDGLLPSLSEMNSKLESIQKQLDQYLEKKRKLFPRFYFLSDNDLLEILGQARDPNAIQHHLKNLFEAIRRLKIELISETKLQTSYHVAQGMYSVEGEYIEFNHPVHLDGHVEIWLQSVENAMRAAIKKNLSKCFASLKALSKDKEVGSRNSWIGSWSGQLLITSSQLYWTGRISETLSHEKEGKRGSKEQKDIAKIPKAIQLRRDEWNLYLEGYSKMIREELTSLEREKLVALITMEVHARDATDQLVKSRCYSLDDFDWLKQLRFYIDEETDKCIVRQTSAEIDYDYEYVGNSGRLVITPLTERCYMTLTTALQLKRGGNPQGPAGTGKTETVKDLGKSIAKYVIVFNCSDSMDYKSLGRLFSGLVQTGAWSCLDEFNRIDLDVLSVVAQQISSILTAISSGVSSFIFEGQETTINPTCGIFVTMNPGYAGRSELPDNLKALLRPVSMMRPDSSLICQIRLRAQGFTEADDLARKVATLYVLMEQQLSRQKHYDFGLRNITAVLDAAGVLKRLKPTVPEHILLLSACRDMNEPKFISDDIPLFNAIIHDLFPGIEKQERPFDVLYDAIAEELKMNNFELNPNLIDRCLQLYDTKKTRHGVMVVGRSNTGKTTAWRTLKNSLTKLNKKFEHTNSNFNLVIEHIINPKAITTDELYGNFSKGRDWKNGIFSVILKETCSDPKPDEKWIVFDGPVDTLWIESMNTLLDDNKVLTLINGTRISLAPQVSLLFEVQDLDQASPATVSRCGMIYFDEKDIGWKSIINTWLKKREALEKSTNNPQTDTMMKYLRGMCEKFIQRAFEARSDQVQTVETTDMNAIQSFTSLYDAIATFENGLDPNDKDQYIETIQKFFVFSLIWSIGATVDLDGRKKLDILFREIDPQLPSKGTAYEYFIDSKSKTWKSWEDKVNQSWKPAPNTPFHKIMVPTVDTVRNSFIMNALVKAKRHILVGGQIGTGKTTTINNVLSQLDLSEYTYFSVNFSARTDSNALQEMIESRVEKKPFDILQPFGGKQLVIFIDDLNMPKKDEYGSQPPLELLRQWIDYGFWYDRQKQVKKTLKKTQLIAAMGPPGGGRTIISERLQNRFNVLNVTFPSDSQTKRIFGTLLRNRVEAMEEVKTLSDIVTQATIDIYRAVTTNLLPTPTRSHYIYNMRDLSKVFQGILQADHEMMDNKEQFVRLWIHECYRVFYDRLNNEDDRVYFRTIISEKTFDWFGLKINQLESKRIIVSDITNSGSYAEVQDINELKRDLEMKLADYNDSLGTRSMNLVLFQDAIEHLCRIYRIINQPRGNALLVGVGGSGRQSLTRLAAYIAGHKFYMVEVAKSYSTKQFHDDLKHLYFEAGLQKRSITFLFSDTQIIEESFLEDVNNMLGSGEVPNLFDNDDMTQIIDGSRKDALASGKNETPEEIYTFFIEQVRNHLHIIVSMSPVNIEFRNRIRMFPSLVNCTTIDWFSEWPATALKEVALFFLENATELELTEDLNESIAEIFVSVHESVVEQSQKMLTERQRHNYVTPTNYLDLITGFVSLMHEKRREIKGTITKYEMGLNTLENARVEVEKMSADLEKQKKHAAQSKQECENLMMIVLSEKSQADDKKQQVELDRANIEREKLNAQKLQATAEEELKAALPDLERATQALQTLEPKDISEIKQYTNPPPLVKNVLMAVMVVLKKKPDFNVVKQLMASPMKFIQMMLDYKKNEISEQQRTKIEKEIKKQGLDDPEAVKVVSNAAYGMCLWVIAINNYAKVYRGVKPLEEKLKKAEEDLEKSMKRLIEAERSYKEVSDKVLALTEKYDQKLAEKEMFRKQAEETEMKLNRAEQLVGGLSGERERWTNSIIELNKNFSNVVGDNLLAASFRSYAGPFSGEYRQFLMEEVWKKKVRFYNVPCSSEFCVLSYLARPTELRAWTMQGLPSDIFSTENGILVTRGTRWPLLIDPQNQANKWVKNLEKDRKLEVCDAKDPELLRKLINAIKFGYPVLIQDIEEEIDPSLEPVLARAVLKKGNREIMMLGDTEVTVNKNFKLYLTTKLQNPHYQPEISTRTTIVNFNVTKPGLEDQLLGIVVSSERKELEEQKSEIVMKVAAGKLKMEELEDETLRLLTTTSDSALLDDESLIVTLQQSKKISEEIKVQLSISQETENKIDIARNLYRSAASRASVLYFVLCDMSVIDPMYQFSLKGYIDLFNQSISTSKKPPKQEMIKQRIDLLNEHHTLEVYRTTCQGLFERHKLLFAFHMCMKIMEENRTLNLEEYNFLIRGSQIIGTKPINPCKWLPDKAWENVSELKKLPNFHGIANSFEEDGEEWRNWYRSMKPETQQVPSEWQSKINDWAKLLLVRSVREDRVRLMMKSFIAEHMGSEKYVKPPINEISHIMNGSTCGTPLMFILSPGVDPQKQLEKFAKEKGIRLITLALGKDQEPLAKKCIQEARLSGDWVFLANCHLMIKWMPSLDVIIESFNDDPPNPNFRLWLSSKPHDQFPITLLQRSRKITTEPPQGLQSNLERIYRSFVSEERFKEIADTIAPMYKKLLYSLAFFHSVLLERRKFGALGWNIPYDFNDSDLSISENILEMYLRKYERIPWEALTYLIAEVNYGGRVTDDMDRRVLDVYIHQFFNQQVIDSDGYALSTDTSYHIPPVGNSSSYLEFIKNMKPDDHPEAFGQHSNADISSQIQQTQDVLGILQSITHNVGSFVDKSATKNTTDVVSVEQKVFRTAEDIYLHRLPEAIDLEKAKSQEDSALSTVLMQESVRYNHLLEIVRTSLTNLMKAIKGEILMDSELESVCNALNDNKVPRSWNITYPSLKPLTSWIRDLQKRIDQFKAWAERGQPTVFWLPGFTFPSGFLTAIKQNTARAHRYAVDELIFEYIVMSPNASLHQRPKDGVYVKGMILEGAKWDSAAGCLVEPNPMELTTEMPVIHCKPIHISQLTTNKKKSSKETYNCPLYMFPVRCGTQDHTSFVTTIGLKSGNEPPSHWVKRGTALLLSDSQ